jgi:hypothetical protein
MQRLDAPQQGRDRLGVEDRFDLGLQLELVEGFREPPEADEGSPPNST